jgi:hypothetical protein
MPRITSRTCGVKTTPHRLPGLFACITALAAAVLVAAPLTSIRAQSPYASNADFTEHARMLRENALMKVEPQVFTNGFGPTAVPRFPSSGAWKENIITTIFWIGEQPTRNNPTPNHSSSWDPYWAVNYGGFDNPDPSARRNFIPVAFIPRQNPFYCALPYNDVTRGTTKPESRFVIPWFKQAFVQEGHTVCKDHWVAIRHGARVVYAQWEDCGPFRTDHYQYVFGYDRPLPNLNDGAGLDVSPAVRDYLGMNSTRDVCSWRFVNPSEVPNGPWQIYGDNNTFVINRLKAGGVRAENTASSNSLFGN